MLSIDLSLGTPSYGPPEEVTAIAKHAFEAGASIYSSRAGLPALRAAIAKKLCVKNSIQADSEQIVVTAGASMALFAAMHVLCEAGNRVLIPDPGYPHYQLIAQHQQLRFIRYPLRPESGFQPDWDFLARRAPETRLLVWNSPSNPVGAIASADCITRLLCLLDNCPQLYLLSDEVYEDLLYRGCHRSPAAVAHNMADRILSVYSFSKSFGMAGLRIGYVHGSDRWPRAIAETQWQIAMSASTMAQYAGLAALCAPPSYRKRVMRVLELNKSEALTRLKRCGLECHDPAAGFYVWVKVASVGLDGTTFAERCANECKVQLSPGHHFGATANDYVRISFAVDPGILAEALDRIERLLGT